MRCAIYSERLNLATPRNNAKAINAIMVAILTDARRWGVPLAIVKQSCKDLRHFVGDVLAFKEASARVRRSWAASVIESTPLGDFLESEL